MLLRTNLTEKTMRVAEWRAQALVFGAAVIVALLVGLLLGAKPAHSVGPLVVNSPGDESDTNAGDGICDVDAATAGEQCTIRAAIEEANANNNDPTVDVINFAIPGPGPHTISPDPDLPLITEAMTINGYSESLGEGTTPASANTLAVGNNAVLKIELRGPGTGIALTGNGLKIEAANSTVQGLIISNWENGIFLGVDATGNTVRGNFIGTDPSGTADLDNNLGVALTNAQNSTIGGTTAAARNIISDNGAGISISGGSGNKVQGNYIGTSAAGNTELGNFQGMVLSNAPNNTIGGTTAAARNIISGNGSDGVEVRFDSGFDTNAATGNRILSNSIYDNDALGIDLVHSNDPPGVNINDDGDGDGGNPDANPPDPAAAPNRLQNFPVITSAKLTTKRIGGHRRKVTLIKGTLNSWADKTYNVQFFGSPEADDLPNPPYTITGYGEGKTFLGQKNVNTNSSDNATFTFTTKTKVPKGQVVTATATDQSTGDTSEFSNAVTVS